jgi:3,4-dihydroxy 2-butanone 4-phosphate synthase/GTP cyclohydrolase II
MKEITVTNMVTANVPTGEANFLLSLYHNNQDNKEHLALILGNVSKETNVLVRVHSECFTGDVLGSHRCDCGEQLKASMQKIAAAEQGILIYLRQEGRGIGLLEKLRAYNLQDQGYDTVDANLELGHQADEREYTIAARILQDLEVNSIQLLTNNPDKINHLTKLGIKVTERIPVIPTVYEENASYLHTKITRMNHMLRMGVLSASNM